MWSLLASALVVSAEPVAFDAFLDADTRRPRSTDDDARAQLVARAVFASQWEPRTGTPTTVWLPALPPGARSARAQGLTAEEVSRRVLFELAPLYRAAPATFSKAALTRVHDLGDGAVVATFHRRVGDVPVFRERLAVVLTHELEPVAVLGTLSPHAAPPLAFPLTADTARAVALEAIGARDVTAQRARRVLYATADELIPAWQLELDVGDDAFTAVVSARDGRRLSLSSRVAHAGFRVWAKTSAPFTPLDGPEGDTAPHPTGLPDGWAPASLAPAALVTLEHAGLATMDPWLPALATTLSGNNVVAYADRLAPDGRNDPSQGLPRLPDGGQLSGDPLPDGGSTRSHPDPFPVAIGGVFDVAYTDTLDATASDAQNTAAATHAFFVANWLHDLFYDVGFDERAGNAQADNKGRGGLGGDPLLVEVNDFSGAAPHARFVAASDGTSPRVELFAVTQPGRARATFSPALNVDAGQGAPPMRPGAWNVSGPVVRLVSADGGMDPCGPVTNAAALAGAIALARASGPCGSVAGLDDVAVDAGALGLLLVGGFDTREPGITLPTQVLDEARADALLSQLDGGAVTATLERVEAPSRPAALDSTLVAHEFGHLVASRLTDDGLISSQGRALAEGTGDLVALLATLEAADLQRPGNVDWRGAYAVGGFVAPRTDYAGDAANPHLFGVRRFPYSVDPSRNALTLRHIVTNVPLPTTTPQSPFGGAGPDNATAQNAGEVWASALWEVTTRLLRDARFTSVDAARRRMLELLVASLQATPATPTLVEGRDAFVAVSRATGVAELNHALAGFGARGLGLAAQAINRRSPTNAPVAEDFTTTGARWVVLAVTADDDQDSCDNDGVLDRGETGFVELTLMNVGASPFTASRLTLGTDEAVVTLGTTQVTVPTTAPFAVSTVRVAAELAPELPGVAQARVFITSSDPFLDTTSPVTRFLRFNTDLVASAKETFDGDVSAWQFSTSGVPWEFSFRAAGVQNRLLSATLVAPNAPTPGLSWATTPPLLVGTGALSFTFTQTYGFESNGVRGFDGAQLRLSVDGGPFEFVPGSALSRTIGAATIPGYDGQLVSGSENPLAGQDAFFGAGPTQTVTVNLGTQYAGRSVRLQFVIGTDLGGVSTGWSIDTVEFTGLAMQPFSEPVAHRRQCVNKPPQMQAVLPQAFDERTRAVLVPPATTDPNDDPITFQWERQSGPMVTVTGNEFDVPEVRADTQMTFRLTADDGRGGTSTQIATVTLRNVNRVPRATAGPAQTVRSGATVTLSGSADDADGDTLVTRWTQLGGPEVSFSDVAALDATFVAPEVTTASEVNLELNVSDGPAAAPPARVTIVVTPRGCGCSTDGAVVSVGALALVLARRRRSRA